nr:cryptochrome/photolyase family protein [Methylonatrum kenyense]
MVLGDQLDAGSTMLRIASRMAEVSHEAHAATHVWSHKARLTLFLSAMRHSCGLRGEQGFDITYHALESHENSRLAELLKQDLKQLQPSAVRLVLPRDFRVHQELSAVCKAAGVPLETVADGHFIDSPENVADWASGRQQLRLE